MAGSTKNHPQLPPLFNPTSCMLLYHISRYILQFSIIKYCIAFFLEWYKLLIAGINSFNGQITIFCIAGSVVPIVDQFFLTNRNVCDYIWICMQWIITYPHVRWSHQLFNFLVPCLTCLMPMWRFKSYDKCLPQCIRDAHRKSTGAQAHPPHAARGTEGV